MHAWIFKSFSLIHFFYKFFTLLGGVMKAQSTTFFSLGNVAKLLSSINSLNVKIFGKIRTSWNAQVIWHLPSYSALILRVSSGPLWADVTRSSHGMPKFPQAFLIFSQWLRSEVEPIITTTLHWLFGFRSN